VTKLNIIAAGSPASIAVAAGSPQSAAVGTLFATNLQVTVTDASGNPVNGVTVTFTVPASSASATLSANTATTDCDGHASVMATANTVSGTYQVTASVTGVSATAVFTLTNTALAGQTLTFTQQPTNTAAGDTISPVIALFTDAYNNPVSGANVVLSLQGGTATLHGTLIHITDSTGHATFSDLSITTTGTYQLQATANGLTALSNSFSITAGSAITIAVSGGSGQSAAVGTAYAAPLEAIVHDAYGNLVPGASVTFTAPTSGAGVTFGGAAAVTTDANGIATSPAITANSQTGSFQVTATTAGASSPATFTLTNVAGAANKLALVQQPTDTNAGATIAPAVTLQLQDSLGNAVHTSGVAITLQLVPGQTLSGTLTQSTDANGLATFANLSVQRAGQYHLLAETASIVSAESAAFTIRAGATASIQATGGTPQSATVLTTFPQSLQASVTDSFANPVSARR
jgi:adhesin/invasin